MNFASQSTGPKRCAVYTRKSREEGLDQEFNSLDAQAEACRSFIASQRHEGWVAIDEEFRDPGYSAGTLERPAIQRLIKLVERDEVDIIVVYKIDRLSRSIMDFAHLIELFRAHDVSFVAVTQSINTSDAMGKLLLNVLMSFAQFERENTAERIRDKIDASKRRGMWMGGPLPFGYISRDKQLVRKPAEARIVRHLFKRFIELGSVQRLSEETRASSSMPDFAKSRLYKMFSNPIYFGKIRHKGEVYDGRHKAIIDEITWAKVQAILKTNYRQRAARTRAQTPALLKGILFGPDGAPMSPSHTNKGKKRYRYYVSQTVLANGAGACPIGRISATEIESLVIERIKLLLHEPEILFSACRASKVIGLTASEEELAALIDELAPIWENLFPEEQARLVNLLVEKVVVHLEHVEITLRLDGLQRLAGEAREAA